MRARLAMAWIGCAALLLGVSCSAISSKPKATNLCAIAAHPGDFDHKAVQVHAVIESDGIEHTGLIDESCSSKGMALSIPDKVANHPDVKRLIDAIFRDGQVGTIGKRITATVSGTFLSRPDGRPSRELVLESVSDLKVSRQK